MIIAVFDGSARMITAPPLYQWDYGQVLRVQGLKLPGATEVHFAYKGLAEAERRIGTVKDNVLSVTIPDSMLEQSETVYAYVYVSDSNEGKTEYRVSVPMIARQKPEAWERPEDKGLFDEALEELREDLKKLEDVQTSTSESEKNAKESAEAAETAASAVLKAQEKAETAADTAVSAKKASETAQKAAEAAADHAEQSAATLGYACCDIDANGHLIMTKTDNILLDLELKEGRLIQIWE